ncbi:MAG: hypothetical protein LC624_07450 [Halobacteriales archaeon]|nr:hypothetical protein [Halobacteriales archaeon]
MQPACYAGDIQSVLFSASAELRFTCSQVYAAKFWQYVCHTSGTFPASGPFTLKCHARLRLTTDPEQAGSGQTGGLGGWGCNVAHYPNPWG